MADVATAGRMGSRRSMSGNYNPLADKSVQDTPPETWVCTAEHGVKFYTGDSLDCQVQKEIKVGAQINATKEGNWLREKESGLYAPAADAEGNRNFKNQRLLLLERTQRGDRQDSAGDLSRTISKNSYGSSTSGKHSSQGSTEGGIARRQSFRWVDDAGQAHRLEGTDQALKDMNEHPEVWICIADSTVPYRNTRMLDDFVAGKECAVGAKVNAVKEDDDWLRVLNVKQSFDAPASLGRRSFKAATRIVLEDTGLFLPFTEKGQRLFKNQKLVLFEEASQQKEAIGTKKDDGSCTVM